MLDKIKTLLSITDDSKDELLETMIEMAVEDAVAISHNKEIVYDMPNAIIKMVIYNYNRLGTEGLTSESYSGVRYDYDNSGYPQEIIDLLNAASSIKGKIYFI